LIRNPCNIENAVYHLESAIEYLESHKEYPNDIFKFWITYHISLTKQHIEKVKKISNEMEGKMAGIKIMSSSYKCDCGSCIGDTNVKKKGMKQYLKFANFHLERAEYWIDIHSGEKLSSIARTIIEHHINIAKYLIRVHN